MSLSIDRDKTELFTVVGAPYVAEQHTDSRSHYAVETADRHPETGIAVLWALFYLVISGAWLFSQGSVGRAFEYAVALLK